MKCLIEVNEKLGDKTQAKDYKSKLEILKIEWNANFKTTENGQRLDRRFKKIAGGLVYPQEGQYANWDELWADLIRDGEISSAEFHYYRSEETVGQCSAIYLEIAKLIDENGTILNEILLFRAEENNDID